MICKLNELPGLFGKSSFSTHGLFYLTDAIGTMRAMGHSYAFAGKQHFRGVVSAFHNNKLRDLFRSMHEGEQSNGARYDAFYNPQSIQEAFVACNLA